MKICDRAVNLMQVLWPSGHTVACCWAPTHLGDLLESDFLELRHGESMRKIITPMLHGDYSLCSFDSGYCLYAAQGILNEHMVDINSVDDISDYPRHLMLAFENTCNYNCTCCGCHTNGVPVQRPEDLNLIAKKLEEILPHVKTISANGAAELFCSPRILKLLADWKPIAPASECHVELETNGSLFTPENWKKIENLGQYNLFAAITVMSFHETTYQHLSGTKLPFSQLEKNLHFIKSLREQGVINTLHLATVVQEENFREMPEFTRRCLDEFGADAVRLRPLLPGGIYDENVQWFMDIRNPEHPYFEQYQKMLEDPIFKDPRVFIWSGNLLSGRGIHPGVMNKKKLGVIEKLLDHPEFLTDSLNGKVAVYNMGVVGRTIVAQCKDKANIIRCYSTHPDMREYRGVPVMQFSDEPGGADAPDTVVIAAFNNREKAVETIRAKLGQNVRIIDIWEKLEEYECSKNC